MVSCLIYRSVIHFEFIVVYGVIECSAVAAAAKLLHPGPLPSGSGQANFTFLPPGPRAPGGQSAGPSVIPSLSP